MSHCLLGRCNNVERVVDTRMWCIDVMIKNKYKNKYRIRRIVAEHRFEELRANKHVYANTMNTMSDSMAYTSTPIEELNIRRGTVLSECYTVMDLLGEGASGYVTKCFSIETCDMEAVKIMRKFPGLPTEEKNEVAILEDLRCLDPDTSGIIKWNCSFTYQDHICISCQLLDQDLHEYVKNRGKGWRQPSSI